MIFSFTSKKQQGLFDARQVNQQAASPSYLSG